MPRPFPAPSFKDSSVNSLRAALTTNRRGERRSFWPSVYRRAASAALWTRGALGRHLSVRWKLTLWYGLMCAVTLGLVGLGMSISLQRQVKTSIDSSLQGTAAKMSHLLAQTTGPSTFDKYAQRVQNTLYENSYQATAPGQFEQVQLSGPSSCLVQSRIREYCGRARGTEGGLLLNPFVVARAANHPQFVTIRSHGELYRAYLTPLQTPATLPGVFGVLEVFQQEHNYIDIQNRLNLILLFGIPVILLIALVAGWWIARAALRPIDRISRTVQSIRESRDLSRRVRFVGPHDEVGRLAETFDGMMDRLEKVFETQRRFVADASHELRTPLTAIRGNAELYSIAPAEERDLCVASIRREAERMSRLVADLLLLAAADIEEQPVHKRPIALDEVLTDVYRAALIMAADGVSVSLDAPDHVTIEADPDRIKQLVLNLVDNAVKFTPAGGQVTIALRTQPHEALIQVVDTGSGIPIEEHEAIFERLYRLEGSRGKRGSGLGLAICAWIAAAHGGRIDVESQPGRGSTFTVHLPGPVNMDVPSHRELISQGSE